MIRRPPRSTQSRSSAASDVYKRQVYVSLPTVGQDVAAGDACGELESTKSVSEVFSPVDGVVSAVNDHLADTPETVNSDPYGAGWLFEIELAEDADLDDLLDSDCILYTSPSPR